MKKSKIKYYGSQQLKKHKAWKAFSLFIRARDKKCVTCSKPADQTGHYIPGSVCGKTLYFSEINNNGQCAGCNLWKSGNLTEYALFLQRKHGVGILESLNEKKIGERKLEIICRYSSIELEEIYQRYKKLLTELESKPID